MGYLKDSIYGFGWMGGFRVITRVFAFFRTIILARILTPSQFGVFGIVLIVLAILELLTETGINIFLIQTESDDTDKYINTAWVVSVIRGIVIAVLIFLCAPFIGKFFAALEVTPLLYLVCLVPLIRGFINPSEVKLQKNLQFKKEFLLRTSVFFIDSLVAIITVFIFKSPIALAFGLITGSIFELLLSFLIVKPLPQFKFDKEKFFHVINRGKWITLAGVFEYLSKNGDNLVVGKLLGTAPLGFYQMAYTFSTLPVTEISDVSGKVVFPIYTRISDDKKRFKRAYLMLLVAVTLITIPLSLIFFLFASQITLLILGEKWLPMVDPLRILAIFGSIKAISGTSSAVFLALKRQELVTLTTFIRFFVLAATVIPLTLAMGIYGTSIAALISSLVVLPIILYNLTKVLK